ncbi:MAG TPA: tyrosine-type recombinase/integrase [Pirellulales bacterium]|jgi:integrase
MDPFTDFSSQGPPSLTDPLTTVRDETPDPKSKPDKPKKPRPDFPLFPHASGRWAKKVKGKFAYFGKVGDDPDGVRALQTWIAQKDDLLAGRVPRTKKEGGATILEMCNRFMADKEALLNSSEIAQRTFDDYWNTTQRLLYAFSKDRPITDISTEDFGKLRTALSQTWGPVSLGNEINRVRIVFKYAFDVRLLKEPVVFGPGFKRPSKQTLRRQRRIRGKKLLTAEQLRSLIEIADVQLKAMILLGLNCGFGNADIGLLPIASIKWKAKIIEFPRPKTEVERRCPLWPETITALRAVLATRKEPKLESDRELLFITKYGFRWAKETRDNPITKAFVKLLQAKKLHRPGLAFYALRHMFETIGGESKDQVAVNAIMGHVDTSMAEQYRESISDERLLSVTNLVRSWLYPAESANA